MFQLRSNFAFIFDRQLASFFTRKNESIWEILNKLRFLDNSFFFFVFTKSYILLSAVPEFSNQVTVCALAVKTSAYVIPFRGTSSRPKAYKLKYSFAIPLSLNLWIKLNKTFFLFTKSCIYSLAVPEFYNQ